MELRMNRRPKPGATTAPMPASRMAPAASSRLEPQPKLGPPTMMSPGWTLAAKPASMPAIRWRRHLAGRVGGLEVGLGENQVGVDVAAERPGSAGYAHCRTLRIGAGHDDAAGNGRCGDGGGRSDVDLPSRLPCGP